MGGVDQRRSLADVSAALQFQEAYIGGLLDEVGGIIVGPPVSPLPCHNPTGNHLPPDRQSILRIQKAHLLT